MQSDHCPLIYLQTQPNLSCKQARWLEFFQQFRFKVEYIQGKTNCVVDALSRVQLNILTSTLQLQEAWIREIKDALSQDAEVEAGSSKWALREDLLWHDGLYIPALQHLQESHGSPSSAHPGISRTIEVMQRHLYWKTLTWDVRDWVQLCEVCQKAKASRLRKAGLLQPLPVPLLPWEQVTMDFIMGLPKTKQGHDCILAFTDKLTRMIHLAATTVNCTAMEAAELFISTVYRLHGLPRLIVSDRDSRFLSRFWTAVHSLLQTKLRMSTAYHPETDGATERSNQTVEVMLRAYVSDQQECWEKYLHLVEFAFNSAENASTKVTPFFMNMGFHPRTMLTATIPTQAQVPLAADFLTKRMIIQQKARQQALLAQNQQAQQANRHRREANFTVGQWVLLSTRNLDQSGVRKLSNKYVGPYQVLQRVGETAYRLQLLAGTRIHNVFHVSLLKQFYGKPPPPREPPALWTEQGEEFEVEKIVCHRTVRRKTQFLVLWLGYLLEEATWEPAEALVNARDVVRQYVQENRLAMPLGFRDETC